MTRILQIIPGVDKKSVLNLNSSSSFSNHVFYPYSTLITEKKNYADENPFEVIWRCYKKSIKGKPIFQQSYSATPVTSPYQHWRCTFYSNHYHHYQISKVLSSSKHCSKEYTQVLNTFSTIFNDKALVWHYFPRLTLQEPEKPLQLEKFRFRSEPRLLMKVFR